MEHLKVHHIGIKVQSIGAIMLTFEMLNLSISKVEDHPEVGLKLGCIYFDHCIIELLEVTDKKSPISKDPFGIHHIGFVIENFSKFYQLVAGNKKYALIHDVFFNTRGKKVFFFKMKQEKNVLYECMEV